MEALIEQQAVTDELVAGDHLTADEFFRRWEKMPGLKRAELIDGRVYMPSPVGLTHGRSQKSSMYWLTHYETFVPQCECIDSATVIFSNKDVPQPDAFLRWRNGPTKDINNYLNGAPELIVEVSHSTAAYDLHEKKELYARSGVKEYIVPLIGKREVLWFVLSNGVYKPLAISADGLFRSTVFPGLWLDPIALLNFDTKRLREVVDLGVNSPEFAAFISQQK